MIREAVAKKEIYYEEVVRNEMFLHLNYYVTESSGHNSEYNWWFRKRPDLIEKYCMTGTGWNPGHYAFVLNNYLKRENEWKNQIEEWINQEKIDLNRGREYAAYIINALSGEEPFEFNGNVPNTGLIPNLTQDACVEVPVLVNRRGLNPMYVGNLPPQLAALNNINIAVEEMAVEGALTGNPTLVYHAIVNDPLTAACLSLGEIKEMVQAMFEKNKDYLPQFGHLRI